MESHDSYPVFHTRLTRTYRRRLTRPDGTSAGWLITTGPVDRNNSDDPPNPTIPHPR